MSETRLTEDMLRIYEGLKKEQKLEFIIESLINEKEEKPHRSEVDGDAYQEHLRNKEAEDQENFRN